MVNLVVIDCVIVFKSLHWVIIVVMHNFHNAMYSWLWNQFDNGLYYFLLVLVDVFVLCLEILQMFLK
jgi:hypothetical protein